MGSSPPHRDHFLLHLLDRPFKLYNFPMVEFEKLQGLAKLIRRDILVSTTRAGSGHPTSSLSAVELMTVLFFAGFLKLDLKNPKNPANDKVIFSKGHATPLLYALYQACGVISDDELKKYRSFDSNLEGHPTPRFEFVDVATGALGQGLSAGVGMALAARLKKLPDRIYVLLGDSEMSEGQIWEAVQIASYYKVSNLIGVLDVNRLGQRGETMLGWDIETYQKRVSAFGWETVLVKDGNNLEEVYSAFEKTQTLTEKPVMIIAKTVKGKGVSFLENADGWHGKAVPKEKLEEALKEIGEVDLGLKGEVAKPTNSTLRVGNGPLGQNRIAVEYKVGEMVATREAYGDALVALGETFPNLVALDAEVSNSTFSEKFKEKFPERFFEMFIAEQNMASVALGMSKTSLIPFVSTFAAFLTRTFDQLRMAQYSNPNIKLVGSHAGVSIGQDGPSQMGLEDLAMMRAILESVVFYPADATSCAKLTRIMAENDGLFYLRTTREKTPIIYDSKEEFKIAGSKVLKQSANDQAVVFTAGITLHEGLKAYDELKKEGADVAVVDLYCVKPLDEETVKKLAKKTKKVIVVEDHYPYGGLGEAVKSALAGMDVAVTHLAVTQIPRSGKPEELLAFEEIDSLAIINAVKETRK